MDFRYLLYHCFVLFTVTESSFRVAYKSIKINGQMLVAVIGARADDEVYDVAKKRAEKHERV